MFVVFCLLRFFKVLFSLSLSLFCTVDHHLARSSASNFHSPVVIFKLFRSRLHTSLKRSFGQPRLRLPTTNSIYNMNLLFIHPQKMTEPAKPVLIEGKAHGGKTSVSQHFLFRDLLLPWNKDTTKASRTRDNIHVSLPYSRVLHTHEQ